MKRVAVEYAKDVEKSRAAWTTALADARPLCCWPCAAAVQTAVHPIGESNSNFPSASHSPKNDPVEFLGPVPGDARFDRRLRLQHGNANAFVRLRLLHQKNRSRKRAVRRRASDTVKFSQTGHLAGSDPRRQDQGHSAHRATNVGERHARPGGEVAGSSRKQQHFRLIADCA